MLPPGGLTPCNAAALSWRITVVPPSCGRASATKKNSATCGLGGTHRGRGVAPSGLSVVQMLKPRTRPARGEIDEAALGLARRHGAQILATARRYAATPEDAED